MHRLMKLFNVQFVSHKMSCNMFEQWENGCQDVSNVGVLSQSLSAIQPIMALAVSREGNERNRGELASLFLWITS